MCTTCASTSTRMEPNPWHKYSGTYCLSYRDGWKLEHPVELLKGNFIRPEDLHHYEAAGIQDFRLDVGAFPTDDILAKVDCYVRRRFDGNLLHLVNMLSIGHQFQVDRQGARRPPPPPADADAAIRRFFELRETAGLADRLISIDNRALDGFLDHFVAAPCPPDCGECDHCERFAARAVTVDASLRDRFCAVMEEYRRAVVEGRFLPGGPAGPGAVPDAGGPPPAAGGASPAGGPTRGA
jgi:hypothetical protein